MLKRITTTFIWVIFSLTLFSHAANGAPGDLLTSFTLTNVGADSATRIPSSPQGAVFYDGYLWVSDFGTDRIYRVYPETVYEADGVTVRFNPGESDFNIPLTDNAAVTGFECLPGITCGGGGITFAKNFFWNASPITDDIIKLDPVDGDNLETENGLAALAFPSPTDITYDGTHFWILDWQTNTISQVLPEDGSILSTIPGPSTLTSYATDSNVTNARPFGMAWDGQHLWASDEQEQKIFRINQVDGSVLSEIDISTISTDPKGLAWDGEFIWLVDQAGNSVYKIDSGVIPTGILGCVEKNGVPMTADALLSQQSAIDQVTPLDSQGCFLFNSFQSGVEVNLSISETGVDEKPVITLSQINGSTDIYLEIGSAYVEPGYAANDTEDGDITANVVATPDVINNPLLIDTSVLNPTGIPINYDVVDSAGNAADTQTRLVFVTPVAYTIGGSVSGLLPGESVGLTNNGADAITVSSDSAFTFPVEVVSGLGYNVQVSTQPTGQTCSVTNGAGTASGDVSNVTVTCQDIFYNINVNVSGLDVGDTLNVSNNAVPAVVTANGVQTIDTVSYNSIYNVLIDTPPANKTCAVGARSDATTGNALSDVTIDIECQFITFTLGGNLTGLEAGDTPALRVEFNTQLTTLSADGPYVLSNTINSGDNYTVTLNQAPTNKNCTITNDTGTALADVTDINIDCIDNIPPTAPTVDNLITNDTTPVITGTATTEAGDVLSISLGAATYDNVPVAGGIWSLDTGSVTPTAGTFNALSDGSYDISATLTDAVSNASTDSSSNELTIDTIAPAIPTVNSITTNVVPPSPITGTATINTDETLSVVINGATFTNVSATSGTWSINLASDTPTSGALGTFLDGNSYEVTATASDLAGNTSTDASTSEIVIDQTAPAAPAVPDMTAGTDQGASATDNITNDRTPDFTGVCTNGEIVTLYIDGAATGAAQSCAAATYTITTPSNLSDGAHTATVTATDSANNQSTQSPALAFTIDGTAPSAPAVDNLITNDTTPVLTGTATLGAGETLNITIGGANYANVTVVTNTWSLDTGVVPPSAGVFSALSDGDYDVVATSVDTAGNSTSDLTTNELTIDTIAPAVPTVNSQTTNDLTPTITGTATLGAGETLSVTVNGATYNSVPTNSNIWSVDTGLLTPDAGTLGTFINGSSYNVVASVTDTAGNTSVDATTNEVTIDVTPPAAPTVDTLITNDLTPTITGTAPFGPGEMLSVTVNGATYDNVSVPGGIWSIDTGSASPDSGTLGAFVDGNSYEVLATVTDSASLATSDNSTNELTIDQTPPAAPGVPDMTPETDRGSLDNDDITSDNTPTFSGTCLADDTITLYVDGAATAATAICAANAYTITAANALTDGAHTISASARDQASNESAQSTTLSVTIDTAAPAVPGTPDLTAASDSGSSDTDNVTGVSNPTFTGTCVDGDTVALFVDGNATGDAAACATSSYSVTLTNALNSGTYAITARGNDTAGNISLPSSALSITIDTTAANAPAAPDMTAATDTGISSDDNITQDTTPTFTGTCTNGDTVALYVDGVASGDTIACSSSTYVLTLVTPLADNNYSITATATGTTGIESPQSQASFITIDTAAPAAPGTPDMTSGSDTGSSNTDNITAETFPIFSGACTNDETITLYLDGLSTSATNLCAGGTYTIATPNALVSNNYIYTATATDAAGNQSVQSTGLNITVDTLAPTTPATVDMDPASDTGVSNADDITSITTPTFNGSCVTGDSIQLYIDGASTSASASCAAGNFALTAPTPLTNGAHNIGVTATDPAGNTSSESVALSVTIDTINPLAPSVNDLITNNTSPMVAGNATLGAGETLSVNINGSIYSPVSVSAGTWTVDTSVATPSSGSAFTPLADASYDVVATVTDTAGNSSADSSSNELLIDTLAPAAPAIPDLIAASDTGSSSTDNITNTVLPTFSGSCTTGETLTLYVNSTATAATVVCAGSTYNLTAVSNLADGNQNISVTTRDLAGNESAQSTALSIVIDTALPAVPTVSPLSTNNTSPTLTGTASLSAGDILSVVVNGAFYNNITVTTGNWSLDLSSVIPDSGSLGVFVDTTYNVDASVTDIAGNVANDATNSELTIDTTAPAVPAVTDMNAASDTGLFDNDNITSVQTPVFTGSCDTGDSVRLYVDGALNSSAVCTGAVYSINASTMVEGSRAITVTATDLVGNESGQSLILSTIIDVTAPAAPATTDMINTSDSGLSNSDDITNVASPTFSGTCTVNDTVTLVVDTIASGATAFCNAGTYSLLTPSVLSEGAHAISLTATDLAGNLSAQAAALNITVDTVAPTQPATPDLNVASDTGSSSTDNITSTTNPVFSGTCTDTEQVKLYIDAVDSGASSICAASSYTLNTPTNLSDNNYSFSVSTTDAAGNESTQSLALAVTIDTSAPTAPGVDSVLTNDVTPVITGTATMGAGDALNVTLNGATYNNVTVSTGTWSLDTGSTTPSSGTLGSFTDGRYEVLATIVDAAGNSTNDPSTLELTIDTTPPAAPAGPDMTDATDTGTSTIDNVTGNTTPDFVGSCTTGETMTLFVDGVGTSATALCTASAYTLGTPSALSEGGHTISVTSTDQAGNQSAQSVALSITIDITPPAVPTAPNLVSSSDTGSSSTDNITSQTVPAFDGVCTSGEVMTLYFNGAATDAGVCIGGSYNLTSVSALGSGNYNVTITASDLALNESAQSPALAITIDTGAPAAPATPDMTAASDSGASNTDNITNINTPAFAGSCTNGEIITLYVDGSASTSTQACAATSYNLIPPGNLSDGNHNLSVTATDAAGNESSESSALTITIDTAAPSATAPDMTAASDTGLANNDDITNDATPTFGGTCVNGESMTLFVDGTTTGLSANCASSTYSITATTPLTDGSHSITATATDVAGNTGAQSTPVLSITVDTNAPTAPVSAPDMTAASDSGASNTDNVTNVVLPTFTGSCSNGETINLYVDANNTGASFACASSTYSLTAPDSLANGNHNITITSTDTAGNESLESAALVVTIDTGGPNVPSTPDLSAASDSGLSSTDNITNVTTPAVTGTCADGDTMRLYVDGSSTTSTVICSSNSYSLTPPNTLSDGNHNLSVSASDTSGNESAQSVALTVTIDTIAVALGTPDLLASSDTGSSATDNVTADNTPSFSGSCINGEQVVLYAGAALNSNPNPATCAGSAYTLTAATALLDGVQNMSVVNTDLAGNVSPSSPALAVTIDTTLPATPTVIAQTANTTTPTLTGTAIMAAGDSLTVSVNGATYDVSVSAGTWSLNLSGAIPASGALGSFIDGNSYNIVATITDSAGNSQSDISTNELTMDTEVNVTLNVSGYSSAAAIVVTETVSGSPVLSLTANGDATPVVLTHGVSYTFAITTQPTGQACIMPASVNVPQTSISGIATTDTSVNITCDDIIKTYAASPALAITANNGNNNALITETSIINVTDDRQIADLNMYINMTHSYAGDVSFDLTSPAGTTVRIIERPGSAAVVTTLGNGASGDYGCSGNNFDVTLDDEGTGPVESSCNPVSGTLTPNNPLSAFDGESSLGNWTLTVYDSYGTADGGTLNNWSLEIFIPTL